MRSQLNSGGFDKVLNAFAGARRCFAPLWRNQDGNVLVITAFAVSIVAVLLGFLIDAGTAWSYRSEATRNLALSCERGTKPSRTLIPDDAERRNRILTAFDQLSTTSPQIVVTRDAEVGWLTASINAQFRYSPPFRKLLGYDAITYNMHANCQGIPPYPHDNELVLSSSLKPSEEANNPMNCWSVYPYSSIGWDEGTGSGVEFQDWRNPDCVFTQAAKAPLPADFPERYVIELDSFSNSSVSKTLELHPGRYRFSVWYNGRADAPDGSTEVNISLQPIMPTPGPEQVIITMNQPRDQIRWQYYTYEITITEYSLYKLKLAAGGISDGYGGLMSTFRVEYLDSL
mgnify:CR=1 FL=1